MLTVLLATHNRAATLRGVLEAYCTLQAPHGGWRLIVVDNGSTDDTHGLLVSYAGRLPLVEVREPRPGKNVALNAALHLVAGDLLVLTDDDAFPHPDWLVQLRRAADEHPEYDIFGGMVRPRWERTPPQWLLLWVPGGPTFTITDTSAQEGPTGAHNVYGPNMAVRSSVLEAGVRFDESIGPAQRSYAMGSETEFVRRLLQRGHRAWLARDAVVEHFIPDACMTRAWVLSRAVRFGRGQYRLAWQAQSGAARASHWFGVPRYLFRQAARQMVQLARARLLWDSEAVFRAQWELRFIAGEIEEARSLCRNTGAGAAAKP